MILEEFLVRFCTDSDFLSAKANKKTESFKILNTRVGPLKYLFMQLKKANTK